MTPADFNDFRKHHVCPTCGRPREAASSHGLSLVGRTASYKEQTQTFTPREAQVLRMLLDAYPDTLNRERVFRHLWSSQTTPHVIDIYVCDLRAKLKPWGIGIETVYAVGYKLVTPE